MRLVEAAVHDTGILSCRGIRNRGAHRRRHCRRRGRWRNGGLLRAALNGCCRRRRRLRGVRLRLRHRLAVSDEFCIAWGARPWRCVGRQPAGPMRPMIGDKTAAAREIKPKSEQSCCSNEPLGGHKGCRMSGARVYIPVCRDGQHSWRDYGAEIACALTISRQERRCGARFWRSRC